jgi:5-methylcytosine-specific restriction protein A
VTRPAVGRRNPPWSRDELILALDLYRRYGIADDHHPEVARLSGVLNELPIHASRPDEARFRNANGVALKLANFASLDPDYGGLGMSRGGRLDLERVRRTVGRTRGRRRHNPRQRWRGP